MRVIVQYIVPTKNILKRDYVQRASVWTMLCSFLLALSLPLHLASLAS